MRASEYFSRTSGAQTPDFTFKAIKATSTIVLLEVLLSLPLFAFFCLLLSSVIRVRWAFRLLTGQDRCTRNVNICVGVNQWRPTPEALESKNRESEDAWFSAPLTGGWPVPPQPNLWCDRLLIGLAAKQQNLAGVRIRACTCEGLHYFDVLVFGDECIYLVFTCSIQLDQYILLWNLSCKPH